MVDLSAYWADHPPLQWMVQGYLGIKSQPQPDPSITAPDSSNVGELDAFMHNLNGR